MRIEKALDERRRLKERLSSAYHMARLCHYTSEQLHAATAHAIASCHKLTPYWVKAWGEGYREALNDDLYRWHLVFGGIHDGIVFLSTHRDREDYYEKHGVEPSAYADDGAIKFRGHYWADDVSKPFFVDKIKEKV